jgi:diadenosine tetraphosphate (Ap4A) HIT family hydrolase
VWRGRHVSEPTQLTDVEAQSYWRETLLVARALEAVFRPAQVNYLILGNQIPHLHTNVVMRYMDDPAPGRSIDLNGGEVVPQDEFESQIAAIGEFIRALSLRKEATTD